MIATMTRALQFLPTLFFIGILVLPSLTSAYTVRPLIIDLETEKRDIKSETITLVNTSDRIVRLYATVNEVAVDADGTMQEFVPPSMSDQSTSVTSWIEISRARIELAPGEERKIPVTIRISPLAKPGNYHAFIGFGTGSKRADAEQRVFAGQAPGTIVSISIDQVRNEFLRLGGFSIDRFILSEENAGVRYEIENPSDTEIVPAGEVIFYDNRGREVGSVPVNPDKERIAPGQSIEFTTAAPADESFGRHKAFLSVEYGTNQLASVHDTTFFYIIPLRELIIIFVVLLIVAAVITVFLHRRYGRDEYDDDDDHHHLPVFVRTGTASTEKDHDLNLKNTN